MHMFSYPLIFLLATGSSAWLSRKKWPNTKMQLARNTNGELAIQEVLIAGEKVKHVLTGRTVK